MAADETVPRSELFFRRMDEAEKLGLGKLLWLQSGEEMRLDERFESGGLGTCGQGALLTVETLCLCHFTWCIARLVAHERQLVNRYNLFDLRNFLIIP